MLTGVERFQDLQEVGASLIVFWMTFSKTKLSVLSALVGRGEILWYKGNISSFYSLGLLSYSNVLRIKFVSLDFIFFQEKIL